VNFVRQILAVAATNVRHIPQRPGNSLVIVISVAGVVAVLISVLAMYVGFQATMRGDGRADRAIVLARSALAEPDSSLSRENVATIENAPGIRHDERGRPMASGEVTLVAPVARKSDSSDVNITLRGVSEQYFAIRPELELVSGRMFHAGNQELVVGLPAREQFAGLAEGDRVRLQDGDWTVVGTFAGGNGARGSEIVADAPTVMSAYKLNAFNSMSIVLDSENTLDTVKQTVGADGTLLVDVRREPEYLASAGGSVNRLLRLVSYAIGSIMALGALFGALSSMHSAVAARTVEIATLRAIGFTSSAVAIAVLLEALLLALVGAAIGVAIAYTAFNGTVISTLGGVWTDTQLVYSLTVTPALIVIAIALACGLGLLGGIFPALHAARANVADALHET
jgi:putative ABC transport system permease protein